MASESSLLPSTTPFIAPCYRSGPTPGRNGQGRYGVFLSPTASLEIQFHSMRDRQLASFMCFQPHIAEALLWARVAKRTGASFSNLAPIHRARTASDVTRQSCWTSDCPCPTLLTGQSFYAKGQSRWTRVSSWEKWTSQPQHLCSGKGEMWYMGGGWQQLLTLFGTKPRKVHIWGRAWKQWHN